MRKVIKDIELTKEERGLLLEILSKGRAKEILHANILMQLDKNNPNGNSTPLKTAKILNTSKQTVNSIKQRYFKKGIKEAIKRKKQDKPSIETKITGKVEAGIIALACGAAPDGRSRWTVRLLADKSIELKIIDSISYVSVSTLLKKHNLSLI